MSRSRSTHSPRKPRVAIALDLDWPYKRQIDVYQGIIEYADRAGWEHVLIPIAEGVATETEGAWSAVPFDGIIARATESLAEVAEKEGVPLVNVWSNSPVCATVPTVSPDFHAIGRRAAQHLLARGLRSLGYIGARRLVDCREEFAGLREEVQENGGKVSRLLIQHSYNRSHARWGEFQAELHNWIDRQEPPFGVFTYGDLVARYLIEACQQKGLRVPEDVAVIGNGNELPLCLQPEPTLTSMDLGFRQVGIRGAEILGDLMAGKKAPPETVRLDASIQLMARHSTDVFAVEDPIVATALRYISEHCHEMINVNDVVENVAASRRSLERHFMKAVNRSVAEEICRLRVRRLERLLVDSDERLVVLAQQCGFHDTEQMRRNFHSLHGVTPTEYRKRLQG
jgi:LacI family transcriptional regulator